MREIFTSGSVGGASGNRRIYPEPDGFAAGELGRYGAIVSINDSHITLEVGGLA